MPSVAEDLGGGGGELLEGDVDASLMRAEKCSGGIGKSVSLNTR